MLIGRGVGGEEVISAPKISSSRAPADLVNWLFHLRASCRAQRSGARLGNRDITPVERCSLGPENVKCMSRF